MTPFGPPGAGEDLFRRLLETACEDPAVLAFWLGGSRGKGRATIHSDYDCGLIVMEATADRFRARFASAADDGVDLMVLTMPQFEALGAWGSDEAWMRYGFAYLEPLVDKTDRVAGILREKAQIPVLEIDSFVRRSLDHFTNQIYRALKRRRDGDPLAARLEAAEAVAPLLDALFAANGGRLRPYYKYLAWELAEHPLALSPWSPAELIEILSDFSSAGEGLSRKVFAAAEGFFRGQGYGCVFDAWGPALSWLLAGQSVSRTAPHLAPAAGIEPATFALQGRCSTN